MGAQSNRGAMPKNSKIQALRMRCRSISRHTDRLMEEQTASHYAFMRIAIAAPTQGDEPRAGDSRIKFGRIGAGACGRPAGWRTRPFKENNRTSNRGGAERRAAPAHLNYPLFREAEGWRTHCAVPADCGCHAGADHWQFQLHGCAGRSQTGGARASPTRRTGCHRPRSLTPGAQTQALPACRHRSSLITPAPRQASLARPSASKYWVAPSPGWPLRG